MFGVETSPTSHRQFDTRYTLAWRRQAWKSTWPQRSWVDWKGPEKRWYTSQRSVWLTKQEDWRMLGTLIEHYQIEAGPRVKHQAVHKVRSRGWTWRWPLADLWCERVTNGNIMNILFDCYAIDISDEKSSSLYRTKLWNNHINSKSSQGLAVWFGRAVAAQQ